MSVFDFLYARAPPQAAAAADLAPSPLLEFLAGDRAAAIARVWPAPHGEFLALPAARRHLAAMALADLPAEQHARVRRVMEFGQMRDALAAAVQFPPRGLARAMGRLGEQLWPASAYWRLVELLREPHASEVLRHAEAIDPGLLGRLEHLPPALRRARLVAMVVDEGAAQALAEAFAAARWINPHRPERDLALAWARAADAPRLYHAAGEAMRADRYVSSPAPAIVRPYRLIASRAALEREALRFRNCVAAYGADLAAERLAVYVREGDPAVMAALKRDVGGWRLAEALAADNAPLEEVRLRVIAAELAGVGVRIGKPIAAIEDRLEALEALRPAPVAVVEPYAAQLGLGQLWR